MQKQKTFYVAFSLYNGCMQGVIAISQKNELRIAKNNESIGLKVQVNKYKYKLKEQVQLKVQVTNK